MDHSNPRSTAKIAGHPIHPMMVMFPTVLFVLAWACDLVFWATADLLWATVGVVVLGMGLVAALAAAVFGLVDYFGDARVRSIPSATQHMIGNMVLVAVQIGNFLWRLREGPDIIVPGGLLLSTFAVLLLGFSAWKGAALVYEHGVGVDEARGASERHQSANAHRRTVDSKMARRQGL